MFGFSPAQLRLAVRTVAKYDSAKVHGLYLGRGATGVVLVADGYDKRSPRVLVTMLHEICHAVQHREGRVPARSYEQRYENEAEALTWSYDQYNRIYRDEYGPLDGEALATFEEYVALWDENKKRKRSFMGLESGFVDGARTRDHGL